MNKILFTLLKNLLAVIALVSAQNAFANNFSITAFGTLPSTVAKGETVSATYTVTNMTSTTRNGYFIAGLPATVTQNTTPPSCGNPINLAPHASCLLKLNITGAASTTFAICKGSSCTTATTPLNVAVSNTPTPTPPTPAVAKYAYVTQGYNAGVEVCVVNTDGSLSSCVDAGGSLSSVFPQGIVLDSNGTHAYISEGYTSLPNVVQCVINQTNGTFSSCSATTITSPSGYVPYYGLITINNNNTYAFIVDYNNGATNRILACPIANGFISPNCVDSGATGLTDDNVGIVLNATSTVAYMGGYGNSYITVCSLNGATMSGCINKNGGGAITFSEPAGVALNPAGTILYVADNVSHNVYGCDTTYNATSSFNNCSIVAALPSGNPQPWTITINSTGTFAYMADYVSTVYSCPILNDGTFGTCTQNTGFPQPVDVAIKYE